MIRYLSKKEKEDRKKFGEGLRELLLYDKIDFSKLSNLYTHLEIAFSDEETYLWQEAIIIIADTLTETDEAYENKKLYKDIEIEDLTRLLLKIELNTSHIEIEL